MARSDPSSERSTSVAGRGSDPWVDAWLRADRDVFRARVAASELAAEDPLDVPVVHHEVRRALGDLVGQLTAKRDRCGRVQLVLGAAGSGKSHLLRVLRQHCHSEGHAYLAAMPCSMRSHDFARGLLGGCVEAWCRPYHRRGDARPALQRLSSDLLDQPGVRESDRVAIRRGELGSEALLQRAHDVAETLYDSGRFHDEAGLGLIPGLLLLESGRASVASRAVAWLRGEAMAGRERAKLGDLPQLEHLDPVAVLKALASLMLRLHRAGLVVALDGLADHATAQRDPWALRAAMAAVLELTERVDTSLVLLTAAPEDYERVRGDLTPSQADRLEQDPEPLELRAERTEAEVAAMLNRRMAVLCRSYGVAPQEHRPLYPLPADLPERLTGRVTRQVLAACQQHRQRCITAGRWLAWPATSAQADETTRQLTGQEEPLSPLVTPTASQGSAQPLKPAASAMPPPTGTSTTPPTTGVTVAEHGRAPSPAATLLIGHETTHRHRPVGLSLAELGGHLAIIADAKRGKTTLAARILEQTLAHGLPVVAVDHDGQLSGYVEATPVQLAGAHVSLHLPANEGDQPLADPANTGRNAASPAVADAPPRLTLFSTARLPSDAARAAWLSRGLQSLAESGTRQRVAVPGGSLRGLLVLDAVDVCLEQAPGGAAALHRLLGDPELGFAVVLTARGGGVVSGLGESVATWLFGRLMRRSDREASAALHRRGLRFNPAKLSMQERGRFLLVREGQPGKTLQAELPAVMPNTPDGDMLRRRAGAVGG